MNHRETGSHEPIDWTEDFEQNRPATPRPPCSGCAEAESVIVWRGAPLCKNCIDYLESHGWKPLPERCGCHRSRTPCSRCGKTGFTGGCACGQRFCDDCINSHFDENGPDFCEVLRASDLRIAEGIGRRSKQ